MTEQQIISSSNNNNNNNSNIPVSEVYWSLVEKADKKFSKIRDLPYYERNRSSLSFFSLLFVFVSFFSFLCFWFPFTYSLFDCPEK